MFSVGFFIFAPVLLLVHGLDLDAALAQGKFEQIFENKNVELDPYNNPASSMYFDDPNNLYRDQTTEITLQFWGELSDEDYKLGLSLLILSFDTDNKTTSAEVFVESRDEPKSQTFFKSDIELPDSTIQEENIIRSWKLFPEDDTDGYMKITVALKDLTPRSKIYFVATSYKVSKRGSSQNKCQPFRPLKTPDWWNCNVNEKGLPLVCLNYDLTCDNLPHCAHTEIPNPDENCDEGYGLKQALQLLIYTLITVVVVMFVAGCARCCLRGAVRRQLMRRGSDFDEILSQSQREPVRPDNAPPTYDDAMKYVNDAFTVDESDENEEEGSPPSYSPQPREGEQLGPGFPPLCNCSRLDGREGEDEGLEGAVGFSDNFANVDLSNLPKDPPPYTR